MWLPQSEDAREREGISLRVYHKNSLELDNKILNPPPQKKKVGEWAAGNFLNNDAPSPRDSTEHNVNTVLQTTTMRTILQGNSEEEKKSSSPPTSYNFDFDNEYKNISSLMLNNSSSNDKPPPPPPQAQPATAAVNNLHWDVEEGMLDYSDLYFVAITYLMIHSCAH